jgi:hypothetical protein
MTNIHPENGFHTSPLNILKTFSWCDFGIFYLHFSLSELWVIYHFANKLKAFEHDEMKRESFFSSWQNVHIKKCLWIWRAREKSNYRAHLLRRHIIDRAKKKKHGETRGIIELFFGIIRHLKLFELILNFK